MHFEKINNLCFQSYNVLAKENQSMIIMHHINRMKKNPTWIFQLMQKHVAKFTCFHDRNSTNRNRRALPQDNKSHIYKIHSKNLFKYWKTERQRCPLLPLLFN